MPEQEADSAPRVGRIDEVLRSGLEWVALRSLGDAELAREALQETLARTVAAVRAGTVPHDVRLPAYACGILRHVIADIRADRRRLAPAGLDPQTADPACPSALEALIEEEERLQVRRAVAAMAPEERELLIRCFVGGERVAELARRLGVPAARIRKRKSRAIARLRRLLTRTPTRHVSPPSGMYPV